MRRSGKRTTGAVALLAAVFGSVLGGCGTYFPVNEPLEAWAPSEGYRAARHVLPLSSDELILMLAFSGGGTRASAFAYGVLEELAVTHAAFDGRVRSLVDEIDTVSGVSGGSFTAAYLGLHGRRMFEDFPERFLHHDVQFGLILRLLLPTNWLRLFSPYWARSDLAAEYYDARVFDGATFGDLASASGPFVAIHATDLTTGRPFAFVQEQFDYLCSDLSQYPVSRAVAASAAVPLVLSPITLRNYHDCGFEPPAWVRNAQAGSSVLDRSYVNARNLMAYHDERRRYVRLVDGVVSDNLGVRGPFENWSVQDLPAKRAPNDRAREVVLLIVNAQTTPDVAWDSFDLPLSLSFILDAATSAQVNRYNLETVELLHRSFEVWNAQTTKWDPPQHFHVIEISFIDVKDPAERARLNGMPTSLSLDEASVTRLRRAARAALRDDPGFRELLERLNQLGAAGPQVSSR
jgi:NTE family protein